MPRKLLIDSRDLPYHVTARANNREAFPGPLSEVWDTFTFDLYWRSAVHGIKIHAFVLMPNHFHLLLTTPSVSLSVVMQEFMSTTTRIMNEKYHRWGRLFGSRYNWSLIKGPLYYAHALKYVYRNPVKAGLCKNVCDYPFSTISLIFGEGYLPFSIEPPKKEIEFLVPKVGETYLSFRKLEEWLDEPHKAEENQAIKAALRRREFTLPLNRETRTPIELPIPE